jgi:hypothetical protein
VKYLRDDKIVSDIFIFKNDECLGTEWYIKRFIIFKKPLIIFGNGPDRR